MSTEWWLLTAGVFCIPLLLRRQCRSASFTILFFALAGLLAASGFVRQRSLQRAEAFRKEIRQKLPHPRGEEYVSSANCRSCHPQQYATWHRSFHRTMTQVASPETVRGNFNDVRLKMDGDEYRLERRGDEFWVQTVDPDWKLVHALKERAFMLGDSKTPPIMPEQRPMVWKQVDMLTGSHHMQAYWVAGDFGNQQFIFPFIYLFEDQRWVPRDDGFIKDPSAARLVQVWNGSCIGCHATAGNPRQDAATSVFQTKVAELGIACEACHGPAADHVRKNGDPVRRYALHSQRRGDSTIINPSRLNHQRSSEVCGQCHGVRYIPDQAAWMARGFRYRPGAVLDEDAPLIRLASVSTDARFPEPVRKNPELLHGSFWPDGMIRVSGREYNGLIESPCFQRGEMSCLSCHSMHKSDPNDQLAAGMESNQACYQCHDKFRQSLAAHTHHSAASSGSLCYNCHMPHTTYGLLKAIRSHQISNPSVESSVKTGRPNACNLCHLDKPLGWTSTHLAQWYNTPKPALSDDDRNISAAVTWVLRGDAGQRGLLAWHMGWSTALEVSGADWVSLYLSHLLADPYSGVRYLAHRSLKRQPGFEKFSYDYIAPGSERWIAQQKAFDVAGANVRRGKDRPALLLDSNGRKQTNTFARLAGLRNNQPMDLLE